MIDRVARLSSAQRLSYLAFIAHGLTVAARDSYEVGGAGLTHPARVRHLNEVQHRVTGALADLLSKGASTYTAESLTEMILDCGEDAETRRMLRFFVEAAVHQTEGTRSARQHDAGD